VVQITGEIDQFGVNHSRADESSVLHYFTLDRESRSSIRRCIELARSNLGPLRHLIPSELWLEVNRLYLDVQRWSPASLAAVGAAAFFADLRDRFYTIAGVIESTMPRDQAYDFIQLGTMIERADNVARLLDVKYHYLLPRLEEIGGPSDLRQWAAVLRSASALEAFRKTYGNAITIDRVVEFLVFDPAFPRSVRFCADRIDASIARIGATGQIPAPSAGLPTEPLLAMLRAASAAAVIAEGLHHFLLVVQKESATIANLAFGRYMSLE
ncbi:MAG: alpha-E domain-containing protein, partial [Bradyrhizobium sp.]